MYNAKGLLEQNEYAPTEEAALASPPLPPPLPNAPMSVETIIVGGWRWEEGWGRWWAAASAGGGGGQEHVLLFLCVLK